MSVRNEVESLGIFGDVMYVGDRAADGDTKKTKLGRIPAGRQVKVVSAKLSADVAVAAADTNYNTFTIRSGAANDDGTLPTGTTIATLANGPVAGGIAVTNAGGAFTINSPYVTAGASDLLLWLQQTKTGTGQAVAGATVEVKIEVLK